MWPRAGVKFGSEDAVDINLLREWNIDSCYCQHCKTGGYARETDQATADYISYRRSHVDILSHDKVRGVDCNFILLPWSFPSRLLPNNPHACPRARCHLRRLLGHNILESRHCLQAAFESFTSRKNGQHILIEMCLVHEDRIVGRTIEEW